MVILLVVAVFPVLVIPILETTTLALFTPFTFSAILDSLLAITRLSLAVISVVGFLVVTPGLRSGVIGFFAAVWHPIRLISRKLMHNNSVKILRNDGSPPFLLPVLFWGHYSILNRGKVWKIQKNSIKKPPTSK